ncbi:MAG: substrate-binding periplasmic protein [Woeseiaceae bacterium]
MKKTRPIPTLCLMLMTACGVETTPPELRIATDATFAPFHQIDDSGRATGFDVELARAVAIHAGYEPAVVVLSYADLFAGLTTGTHDLVAATTGITTERQKTYLFSVPYFTTCQVAVVRRGSSEPQTVADLAGKRIGASGTGTSFLAMQLIDGVHVSLNDGEGVSSLLNDSIDAWIVDEFDAVGAARESDGRLKVLAAGIANENYGFVLALGQSEIQSRINGSLAVLEAEGVVADLQARFGVERAPGWPVQCPD